MSIAKDNARIANGKKRHERWEREKRRHHSESDPGKVRVVFNPGQEKPQEVIKPDKLDLLYRLTDGLVYRTMGDKLVRHGSDKGTYQLDGRIVDIVDARVVDGVLFFRMGVTGVVQRVRVLPHEIGYGPDGALIGGGRAATHKPVDKGRESVQGKRQSESPFKRSGARIKSGGFVVEHKGKV